jgi:hypothetical protein
MITLQNAIWLSWIIWTLTLFVAQPRWGGLTFILAALLAPYGSFSGGELLIRADLVLTPLMLGCQFLGISRTRPRVSLIPIVWLFVLWLVWIGLATLMSDREIHLVSANGYIRLVMVMIVFTWIPWQEKDVESFQFMFVMTSIPIGILSVAQVLNIPFMRTLSDDYYSPPSAVVMALQADAEAAGHLYRAVGVFGNVSPAATYFLLSVCISISLFSSPLSRRRRSWLLPALAASISGGLATLSATFVGGILLTIPIAVFNSDPTRRRTIITASVGCVFVLSIIVMMARSHIDLVGANLDYQMQRLIGGELLADRYSSDDGALADAIEEIKERLFLGTGWTLTEAFSGDSVYFSILFCSGIIGSVPFACGLIRLSLASRGQARCGRYALSWTAIMLLGGIGCTSLLLGRLADGWWAIQGMLIARIAAQPARRLVMPPADQRLSLSQKPHLRHVSLPSAPTLIQGTKR